MTNSTNDELNDATRRLVLQMQAGGKTGEAAALRLYTLYWPKFLAFFKRHGVNAAEAEDLAQDTFLKITTNVAQYRGESLASAWLWAIARNLQTDYFRGNKRQPLMVALDDDAALNKPGDESDPAVRDCLRRAFTSFAAHHPDRAELVIRGVMDGWDVSALSSFLGRTAGATREYISQCRKKLNEALRPCYDLANVPIADTRTSHGRT